MVLNGLKQFSLFYKPLCSFKSVTVPDHFILYKTNKQLLNSFLKLINFLSRGWILSRDSQEPRCGKPIIVVWLYMLQQHRCL